MTTVFIVIGVALLVTLFVAFRYDHRHKRLDDSATGGVDRPRGPGHQARRQGEGRPVGRGDVTPEQLHPDGSSPDLSWPSAADGRTMVRVPASRAG